MQLSTWLMKRGVSISTSSVFCLHCCGGAQVKENERFREWGIGCPGAMRKTCLNPIAFVSLTVAGLIPLRPIHQSSTGDFVWSKPVRWRWTCAFARVIVGERNPLKNDWDLPQRQRWTTIWSNRSWLLRLPSLREITWALLEEKFCNFISLEKMEVQFVKLATKDSIKCSEEFQNWVEFRMFGHPPTIRTCTLSTTRIPNNYNNLDPNHSEDVTVNFREPISYTRSLQSRWSWH